LGFDLSSNFQLDMEWPMLHEPIPELILKGYSLDVLLHLTWYYHSFLSSLFLLCSLYIYLLFYSLFIFFWVLESSPFSFILHLLLLLVYYLIIFVFLFSFILRLLFLFVYYFVIFMFSFTLMRTLCDLGAGSGELRNWKNWSNFHSISLGKKKFDTKKKKDFCFVLVNACAILIDCLLL